MESNIADIMFKVSQGSASRACHAGCMACTDVTIIDDPILENKFENFSLSLHHDDPAVHLTSTLSVVTIEDNDGKSHDSHMTRPLVSTTTCCFIDFVVLLECNETCSCHVYLRCVCLYCATCVHA